VGPGFPGKAVFWIQCSGERIAGRNGLSGMKCAAGSDNGFSGRGKAARPAASFGAACANLADPHCR